jgi:hypothetical protein
MPSEANAEKADTDSDSDPDTDGKSIVEMKEYGWLASLSEMQRKI